jgi:ornithine cyclodeaminase/alanine dehydrogenase-like protein (mu-crystallin family)
MSHLDEDQVTDLLQDKEKDVIQYMENVFIDYVHGRAKMIPKVYLTTDKGDFRAMPAQWEDMSGLKWISVYPENHTLELPTIYGTLLLNDTLTGHPIISMDCAKLTGYRTAAVSALAAKHLTEHRQVNTFTFIGCGYQSIIHMKMYKSIFPNLTRVKLYDKNFDTALELKKQIVKDYNIECDVYDTVANACLNADVITTLTPSKQGFLGQSHIKRPVHINAIGADAEGKRELERSIWMKCGLIVDDYEQASHSGEAQYVKDLPYLTLGDIITGKSKSDQNRSTVFDSTGLSIEDIAIGRFIYEEYCKRN